MTLDAGAHGVAKTRETAETITLSSIEKQLLERARNGAIDAEIRKVNLKERTELLRERFSEEEVSALQKLRERTIGLAGDKKMSFEESVFRVLRDSPELLEGLSESHIQGGMEYLWSGLRPKKIFKPMDVNKTEFSQAFKELLRSRAQASGEVPWDNKMDKNMSWHLRLPYRMISANYGDRLQAVLADSKTLDKHTDTVAHSDTHTSSVGGGEKSSESAGKWETLVSEYWKKNAEENEAQAEEDKAYAALKGHWGDEAKQKDFDQARNKRIALGKQREEFARKVYSTSPFTQKNNISEGHEASATAPVGDKPDAPKSTPKATEAAPTSGTQSGEAGPRKPGTTAEHQKATSFLRETTRSQYANFVANKKTLDAKGVEKWMSAPRRWIRALGDGFFRGMFAGGAIAWGSASVSAYAVTPALAALGFATAPAWLPAVVAAGLAGGGGAIVWSVARRALGMRDTDKLADAGWQANKLRRVMNRGIRRGDNPDIERKFDRINKWWRKAIRAQNLIPSLLGGVLGGSFMYEAHTKFEHLDAENIGKAWEGVKGFGRSFWDWISNPKLPEWLKFGGDVQPGTATDHTNALNLLPEHQAYRHAMIDIGKENTIDSLSGQLEYSKVRADSALEKISDLKGELEYSQVRGEVLTEKLNEQSAAYSNEISQLKSRLSGAEQLAGSRGEELEMLKKAAGDATSGAWRTPAEVTVVPTPDAPPQPTVPDTSVAPKAEITPDVPKAPALPEINFTKLENTFHLPIDNRGPWGFVEHPWKDGGFTGDRLKWLTDMAEDYFQGDMKGVEQSTFFKPGLLENVTDIAGVTPDSIPDGTTAMTERFWGDQNLFEEMQRRISRAPGDILNPTERGRAMGILKELFESSQQLLKLNK